MALGLKDLNTGLPELPNNLGPNVGNSLGSGGPSIPSMPTIPNVSGTPNFGAPAVAPGEDPCSSLNYLKNKLTTMPLIGNLSLKDIAGEINLDALTAPKIPTLKEIGQDISDGIDDIGKGISDGISGVMNDIKDGVSGIIEDLKPSNLIPNIKKELGKAGRVALAGALEDAMLDALGPIKGGIGDRIKRSVKTNLMMAGINEVVNILEGKPNIFDPCPGKTKAEKQALKDAAKADTGKMNMAVNAAVADETKLAAKTSTKMARDLPVPIAKPTIPALKTGIPGLGTLPEIPGDPPAVFERDSAKHEVAVAQVADKVVPKVAKEQAEKAAKEDEKKETRDEKKKKGLPASGDNFKPVQQPGSVIKFHYSDFLMSFDTSGFFSKWKKYKNRRTALIKDQLEELPGIQKTIVAKQTLAQLKEQQTEQLSASIRPHYYAVYSGEIHELKSRDFVNFDKAGVPETFYTGWMKWKLYRGGVINIVTGDELVGPHLLSDLSTILSDKRVSNTSEKASVREEFQARYPIYLTDPNSYTFSHKVNQGLGMSLFNSDVLHMSGVKINDSYPDPLYTVPVYWSSYEDAVKDLFMITTNQEAIDLMYDLQYFERKE